MSKRKGKPKKEKRATAGPMLAPKSAREVAASLSKTAALVRSGQMSGPELLANLQNACDVLSRDLNMQALTDPSTGEAVVFPAIKVVPSDPAYG